MWKEAKAPNGRTYYYNTETNATSWEKPADADTSVPLTNSAAPQQDPAAVDAAWRETSTGEGKKYYYNAITRETKWQPPPAFLRSQEQQKQQQNGRPAGPDFVAGGFARTGTNGYGPPDRRPDRRDDRDVGLPQKPTFDGGRGGGLPWDQKHDSAGFRGPMPVKTDEPEYSTLEQAEEAFFKVLRKHNIPYNSTWEDALPKVIRERDYRALKDPQERWQAFEKYCQEARAQEKSKEKERRDRLKEDFRKMLSTHEDIKHYTRWKTAVPFIEREAVYKQAENDTERRQMFDEYIIELKKKHIEDTAAKREIAISELDGLVQALIIDPNIKLADAERQITDNERFASEDQFRSLSKVDIFNVFKNHMTALDRIANDKKQNDKRTVFRGQRKARDQFKELLAEKLRERSIKASTRWQDLHPMIENDVRFLTLLGQPGSGPLEFFWDVVEAEENDLRLKRNNALDVLEDKRYEMVLDTTRQEFVKIMRSDRRTAEYDEIDLELIYERLMSKVKRRVEDEKLQDQRQERRAVDAFKSVLKHMDPPIRPDDRLEDILPKLVDLPEFNAVSEAGRKAAFDKHTRRLREREDDYERDRLRREKDRDQRNGSRRDIERDRDHRHRTRTPEVDAYEADRRKAQADRERQYRKPSFGFTPPRDRRDERDDRYRRRDPYEGSVYDRERREREMERERSYVSRADPRDKGRALDYGDEDASSSRPSSTRKRRDSEASLGSRRDQKRIRRGRTPEAAPQEEDTQIQSGSEEGEIEEV